MTIPDALRFAWSVFWLALSFLLLTASSALVGISFLVRSKDADEMMEKFFPPE